MTTLLAMALGLLLQSTTLLLLGLLALGLTRRRGPAVQSLVGRATLAGVGLALLLAAPLAGHVRPLWRVTLSAPSVPPSSVSGGGRPPAPNPGGARNVLVPPSVPLPPITVPTASLSSPTPPELGAGGRSLPPLDRSAPAPQPSLLRLMYPALAAAWAVGIALLLLWLGVCQWHLIRLGQGATPVTSGPAAEMLAELTPCPPILLTHPSVRSPFLAGIGHPAIFLPTTYDTDFSPTALHAILAHELAHLARRDNAWTLAARLLCALLWPQPLLWLLCRRLEQISEEACDLAVLAQDCPPRAYADCLLTLAERHPLGRRERALGAGVAPFRSSLGQRIGRILDKGTHAMSTVTPRLRLTIAALTIAAALGGAFLVSSAPAQIGKSVAPDPAVRVTQEYLTARASGRYADAYALLSPLSKKSLTFGEFQKANNTITQRLRCRDAQAPLLKAMASLFYDTHNTLGYRYRVIDAKPDQIFRTSLVSVSAQGPGLPASGAMLKVALTAEADRAPRLDTNATYFFAPPATYNHASTKLTDFHCEINMKQVGLAIWDYTYHHKDRFPDADRWMDEIKPYLKTEDYYHDPAAPDTQKYSYAYNRNLSGVATDRSGNLSATVMLFESSLNVRNASDTGQSLIEPARHSGHHNFMFLNGDGQAKDGQRSSFALHIAPPSFYSTASLSQLVQMQKRTQARLVSDQGSFIRVDREFEAELRQATPQTDAPKLAQARRLERQIGLQVMGLQNIKKVRDMPKRNHPDTLSRDWGHAERWTNSQLRPLLVREAQLLPNVPSARLARLHSVAASLTTLQFNVEIGQSEMVRFNKERQRRQQPSVKS